MYKQINNVFACYQPSSPGAAVPVVIEVPHSGMLYPINSGIVAPASTLNATCDMYVDDLWYSAPAMGASMLAARFPRGYIDTDRSAEDIDETMLTGAWPALTRLSAAGSRGIGLIRKFAAPGGRMYEAPLTVSEVQHRLQYYYLVYHDRLRDLIADAHAMRRAAWHINCHSMGAVGPALDGDAGRPRPDAVVSDLHGPTANPEFTQWCVDQFQDLGFLVRKNQSPDGGTQTELVASQTSACTVCRSELAALYTLTNRPIDRPVDMQRPAWQ